MLPRERARAPERTRTRNKTIKVFGYVHVYVFSQMTRPLVGFAALRLKYEGIRTPRATIS